MKAWPYVYQEKSGRWVCDTGKKTGTRKRAIFQAETDARKQAKEWRDERETGGIIAALTDVQRLDAVNALKLLEKRKVKSSLLDAVQFYLDRKYPLGGDITVGTALNTFLLEKELDTDLSEVYRWSFNRLERLREEYADTKLSELSGVQVAKFIRDNKRWGEESKRQHFIYFRMFFDWCVKRSHVHANPLTDLKPPKGNQDIPGILQTSEVESLITEAWKLVDRVQYLGLTDPLNQEAHTFSEHRFFPYIVLGVFLGIRPHEISRLRWCDLTNRCEFVRLPHFVSKTADRRTVPVPLNVQVMLTQYQSIMSGYQAEINENLFVLGGDFPWFKKKFRDWRRSIGIDKWYHDCMRHTFASQFLAAHNNMPELMSRMGHSSVSTTLKHYVQLVDSQDWQKFWTMGCSPEINAKIQAQIPKDKDGKENVKETKALILNLT